MTKTALYRHYDADGKLLYVGISCDLSRRTKEHSKASDWFDAVEDTKVQYLSTREHAEDAEKVAIYHEKPLHNKSNRRPDLSRPLPPLPVRLHSQEPIPPRPDDTPQVAEMKLLMAKLDYEQMQGMILLCQVLKVLEGSAVDVNALVAEIPVTKWGEIATLGDRTLDTVPS